MVEKDHKRCHKSMPQGQSHLDSITGQMPTLTMMFERVKKSPAKREKLDSYLTGRI
jgi:hypothetical protein